MRIVLEKYNKCFVLAAALLIVALIAAAVRPYSPPTVNNTGGSVRRT